MTSNDLLAAGLAGGLEMLKNHIKDFTEADMMVRPVPSANHTAWQLGHLCSAEAWMINQSTPGAVPALPAGFSEKFKPETSKIDDPKAFPTKDEILAVFEKTHAAAIDWAKKLTPADMDKPGPERMRALVPTVGALAALLPVHSAMHLGQIQVIRRKLGRPVMF